MLNSISDYEGLACDCVRSPSMEVDQTVDAIVDKKHLDILSPMKTEELSFYENDSPRAFQECISPSHCPHPTTITLGENYNTDTQDSGYGTGRFSSTISPTSKNSICSLGSREEDFLESMSDFEVIDENLPLNFKGLIDGKLSLSGESYNNRKVSPHERPRPPYRRALSLQNGPNETIVSRARSCLFQNDHQDKRFKRPEPPISETDLTPRIIKRTKLYEKENSSTKPILKRFFSVSEESIKCALQRSSEEEELIGDFSRSYSLPLTQGRHQDLKSITSHTLAKLLRGEYDCIVGSFMVIDCRYPYEFSGGHIHGAVNIYTKDQCLQLFDEHHSSGTESKRHILIFHCEFSSERGPNLFRFLRQQDRSRNEAVYPALQYPEIYLLEGGYKEFFKEYSSMCNPVAYKQMLHPEHEEDLRYFRTKSKTWNADARLKSHKGSLKRLGL